jgi:hypothetical protein
MKLKVQEPDLIAMVKAFNDYKQLVEPVAADQPQFNKLIEIADNITRHILSLNKIIHRKYDGMTPEKYMLEVNELLKKSK